MFMASLAGLIALPLMLLSLLLPVALAVALQVWLCKRRSRWLGLILPGLTLLASLLILLSMAAFTQVGASEVVYDEHGAVVEEHHAEHWEAFTGAELGAAGGVFLVANIPTVVLGGIWLHYKNRRDLREEMKRRIFRTWNRVWRQAIFPGNVILRTCGKLFQINLTFFRKSYIIKRVF